MRDWAPLLISYSHSEATAAVFCGSGAGGDSRAASRAARSRQYTQPTAAATAAVANNSSQRIRRSIPSE